MERRMGYSIITTCDSGYFPFLKILVDSTFEVCDVTKIYNFIVVDTGLIDEQREYLLNKSDVIKLKKTNMDTKFKGGVWGDDWIQNVKSKTVTLAEIVSQIDHPLLMLDADMKVLRDLNGLMDYKGDLQVCFRPNNRTNYIGSFFFVMNPQKCLEFIKHWRDTTNNSNSKTAMESPALGVSIDKFEKSLDIVKHPECLVNVVSKKLLKDDSFLVHYKSKDLDKNLEDTLKNRIWNTK